LKLLLFTIIITADSKKKEHEMLKSDDKKVQQSQVDWDRCQLSLKPDSYSIIGRVEILPVLEPAKLTTNKN
jgi:hypothetical protein